MVCQARLKWAPRQQLIRKGIAEDKIAPRHIGLSTEDFGLERVARKNLTRHQWELDAFEPIAYSVYSGPTRAFRNVASRLRMNRNEGKLEETAILQGGDPFAPTVKVQPGALSMIPEEDPHDDSRAKTGLCKVGCQCKESAHRKIDCQSRVAVSLRPGPCPQSQ